MEFWKEILANKWEKKFTLDSITLFQNQRSHMVVNAGPFVKEANPE